MTTPRADDRRPRSAVPASERVHSRASAAQMGAAPALEIACPVCATYNSSLCRYCPHCGYLLHPAPRRAPTPVHPASHKPGARWLVSLLWLVVVVETGLLGGVWLRSGGWPWTTRPMVLSRVRAAGSPPRTWKPSPIQAWRAAPRSRASPRAPVRSTAGSGQGSSCFTRGKVRVVCSASLSTRIHVTTHRRR